MKNSAKIAKRFALALGCVGALLFSGTGAGLKAETSGERLTGPLYLRASHSFTFGSSRLRPVKTQNANSLSVTFNPNDKTKNRFSFVYFELDSSQFSRIEQAYMLLNLRNLRAKKYPNEPAPKIELYSIHDEDLAYLKNDSEATNFLPEAWSERLDQRIASGQVKYLLSFDAPSGEVRQTVMVPLAPVFQKSAGNKPFGLLIAASRESGLPVEFLIEEFSMEASRPVHLDGTMLVRRDLARSPLLELTFGSELASTEGKVGPMGPTGPAGPSGPKGDTGPTGPQGEMGPAGVQGAIGLKGETGPAGPKGDMGPAGPQGEQGKQGADGLAGPAGPQGLPGAAGAKGDKGDKGDAGGVLMLEQIPAASACNQSSKGTVAYVNSAGKFIGCACGMLACSWKDL